VVALSGGSARVGVFSRDHCPPHATCRDTAGQWVVRISFSFVNPTAVALLSVIPRRNSPGFRTINELAEAVRRNLRECRSLWWTYQQNNPLLRAEGACCLNNTRYAGKIVADALYDPGTMSTQLTFSDGTIITLPM
jgi:hypothetical protein